MYKVVPPSMDLCLSPLISLKNANIVPTILFYDVIGNARSIVQCARFLAQKKLADSNYTLARFCVNS